MNKWGVAIVLLVLVTVHLPADERPHVIMIFVDDFGWGDPSCYGNQLVRTPNIDRMASEGIKFQQGYVASPICSPSRCGLLTGQHPARWRITSFLQTKAGNRACEMVDYLDPAAPTLPRILKQSGYATAHVGKWHLGGGRDVTDAPRFAAYGYDVAYGTWESPEPHPDLTSTNWIWAASDKVKRHDRTAWMVDRTIEFIQSHSRQPCFVNLWLDDTHTPFVPSPDQLNQVPPSKSSTPEVAKYIAVMMELDRQVGRLLEAFRDSNTLIFLIGDNGALPTFDQKRVGGLRGSKLSLYEGGIRVPFLAWWPGRVQPSVDESTVISTIDVLPTVATLCRASLPQDYVSDGEDLSQAILGAPVARTKPLYWEYGRNDHSFAYPKDAHHRSPNLAVRDGSWKLLVNSDGSRTELYDLTTDREERSNRASEHPEIARRLSEQVRSWRSTWP